MKKEEINVTASALIMSAGMITLFFCLVLGGCKTVDLELMPQTVSVPEDTESISYLIEEKMMTQDLEETVFVVEKVIYRPEFEPYVPPEKSVQGIEAVRQSYSDAIVQPENYKNGAITYQFNENQVFEVYAQPLKLTDIVLQPGESVISNPLISEDDSVWELTAGVGRDPSTGENIQHLFLKPVYTGLDSTFIIITDKRTYHFRIMSFSDVHMAMVRFSYPKVTSNTWASASLNTSVNGEIVKVSNPDLLSFDYTMTYNLFSVPDFLPSRVYDDGRQTYIIVDESVLHKELPVLFNEKDELLNYTVSQNTMIVPRLINKVTLSLNGQKVTIEKKRSGN